MATMLIKQTHTVEQAHHYTDAPHSQCSNCTSASINISTFPENTYPSELMYNDTDSNTKRLFFFRSNNH